MDDCAHVGGIEGGSRFTGVKRFACGRWIIQKRWMDKNAFFELPSYNKCNGNAFAFAYLYALIFKYCIVVKMR